MRHFTDNPYERVMKRTPEDEKETSRPFALPENHPCYGCGNYGQPCVGFCHRALMAWYKEREVHNHEIGHC